MAETLGIRARRRTRMNPFGFPAGYKVQSTILGDTFPGFNSDVIPLVMSASASLSGGISSGTSDIRFNDIVAGSLSGGGYYTEGGSWYSVNSVSTSKSGSGAVTGIFLPYYFNYDYEAIKNSVTSGTCIVWLRKGLGIDITPKGHIWKLKSTKNGDVFPGFGDRVLPITITPSSASGSNSYHNTAHFDSSPSSSTTASASRTINGITALSGSCTTYLSQSMGACDSHYTDIYSSVSVSAKNLFLPYFYRFNWDSIKANITSGTVVEWFEAS